MHALITSRRGASGIAARGSAAAGDEASLIRAAKAGSADAIEALVRCYWDGAHRAAFLIVHDAAAAEDIAQEAMLAAVRNIDEFDRRRPFRPWLHRIVVNRSLDWLRKRRHEVRVDELPAAETPEPGLPGAAMTALARLDPELRALIVMRHLPLMVGGTHRPPPGPPLTKRPVDPQAAGKPIVLAAGRSPDGARYEWFVEHYENKQGKVYGNCEQLWWPGASAPSPGFCGPGLPPSTAFGRRHPERVFAKPFGSLGDARPATRYLMLSGYARQKVTRVAVVYMGRDLKRHRAPVELTPVDAAIAKRMAASGPFGFFVAFVPRYGRKHPIEVVAYDASGRVLGRYKHRSDPLMR